MTYLTKKQIKAIKKEISKNSENYMYRGYTPHIIEEFSVLEIYKVIKKISQNTDLNDLETLKSVKTKNEIITELIKQSKYNFFKNHLLKYLNYKFFFNILNP